MFAACPARLGHALSLAEVRLQAGVLAPSCRILYAQDLHHVKTLDHAVHRRLDNLLHLSAGILVVKEAGTKCCTEPVRWALPAVQFGRQTLDQILRSFARFKPRDVQRVRRVKPRGFLRINPLVHQGVLRINLRAPEHDKLALGYSDGLGERGIVTTTRLLRGIRQAELVGVELFPKQNSAKKHRVTVCIDALTMARIVVGLGCVLRKVATCPKTPPGATIMLNLEPVFDNLQSSLRLRTMPKVSLTYVIIKLLNLLPFLWKLAHSQRRTLALEGALAAGHPHACCFIQICCPLC
mmetsp:Transcript_76263/g.210459  ORF Transcript_76263/g.210459 Transcript_76263/m.210459 type:complete len:295 (+) Transcript_76263:789-1673(+)